MDRLWAVYAKHGAVNQLVTDRFRSCVVQECTLPNGALKNLKNKYSALLGAFGGYVISGHMIEPFLGGDTH